MSNLIKSMQAIGKTTKNASHQNLSLKGKDISMIRPAKKLQSIGLCPISMGISIKKQFTGFILVLFAATGILTGCSSASPGTASATPSAAAEAASNTESAAALLASSKIVLDKEFTANDLEVGYEESEATHINLKGSSIEVSGSGAAASDNVLTISSKGVYIVSGTLDDGQIVIDAKDTDKIRLVLNGASVNCSDNAPIYIKKADKVFITLEKNTANSLTDGATYVQNDENSVDGVIFSKSDLTLNGDGTLNITANYKHGIVSKDELVFTGGTYNITAVKDAINGKDCVKIKDGSFTLSAAAGNGIQSKNDEDAAKGYVYICGGTITVTNSREGIEGTAIVVDGGTIDITASDDGLNAASGITAAGAASTDIAPVNPMGPSTENNTDTTAKAKEAPSDVPEKASGTTLSSTDANVNAAASATPDSDFAGGPGRGSFGGGFDGGGGFGGGGEMGNNTNCYISVSAGTIHIKASGDGIDSNGSINISGGSIFVSGPSDNGNAGMDYNGTADITGGTIVVAGSTGMAQGFSDTSTQYSILWNLSAANAAGEEVTLTDKAGNVIISYTPENQYQSLVISTPELADGETYTLSCKDQTEDITLSSIVTSNAPAGTGGRMFGGDRPDRGNMPNMNQSGE